MRAALRLSSRRYSPRAGALLVIAPHADDETLGCGGLIASQTAEGRPIAVAYLTDSAGSPPVAGAAETRRLEALAALATLGAGAGRIHFLGLPDGSLDRLSAETARSAVDRLAGLMKEIRPAEVFAPYRHGGSTEQTAALDLTVAAVAASGGGCLMEYPVWAWWNPLRLRFRLGLRGRNFRLPLGAWRELKVRALACHRSQVAPVPPSRDPALPPSLALACCGPSEFFFASRIPAGQVP